MSEDLVPIKAAAGRLGVEPVTLQRQAHAGKLRATKVARDWYVTEAEIARYRAEHLGKQGWANRRERRDGEV